MPFVTIGSILNVLKIAAGSTLERRNDPKYWSVDIEPSGGNKRKGKVTGVSFEATDLTLTVDDAGTERTLTAHPVSASKTKVLVDGDWDSDAVLVFDPKPSLGNPTRYAFDFKRVTIDGEDHRFNFRYDP